MKRTTLLFRPRSPTRTLLPTGARNAALCFSLASALALHPIAADIRSNGRCGPCGGLHTVNENFDGVMPPALPVGWVATNALGPPPFWTTSNSGLPAPVADTLPNAAFVDDPPELSDKRLDSLSVTFFEGGNVQLIFRHDFNLEASDVDPNVGFDGGVLEVSEDGGNTFQDILAVGGTFESGGYNRTISTDRDSPIAGRRAWSGNSAGFMTTIVDVPAFQGPSTKFRWRMASDNTGSGEGWRVDTVSISWCHHGAPCTPIPRPTPAPRPGTSGTPGPHSTPAFTPVPRPTP